MEADLALYAGLFAAAFIAATILPVQSEAVFISLMLAGHPVWLLLIVASVGNVLGSVMNWLLGRGIERFHNRRWFPVKPAALERARAWYQRFGRWSLLFSWAPLIGDPLTIVAGVLRERLAAFVVLVAVAKTGRYAVLAWVTHFWLADAPA